jgi:tetratricopeptide (TPR) repeat protein
MGRTEQSLAEVRTAQQLDPASPVAALNVCSAFCELGQYERGIAVAKEALTLEPNFAPVQYELALCYLQQKMYSEAIAVLKGAQSHHSSSSKILGALAFAYSVSGNRDHALRIVEELKSKSATETDDDALIGIAQVFVGLDDKERALEWLEKAYQRRSFGLRELKSDFIYEPLRSDPRFKDLQRRVGLPP